GQRSGNAVSLCRHEVARMAACHLVEARQLCELRIDPRASACCRLPQHGDYVLPRAIHEELKLTVLIDWAETGDRRGSLAILAQTLGPQLNVPMGETAEAVGVRHHHTDADAFLLGERDVHRSAHC